MVVPGLYRWLTSKFSSIVQRCHSGENSEDEDSAGSETQKTAQLEIDNLYVDLAGVVSYCNQSKSQPKDEDEMVVQVFDYIDRIFNVVKPKHLVYLAMDGVAPRVKVDSMRARRYMHWIRDTEMAISIEVKCENPEDQTENEPQTKMPLRIDNFYIEVASVIEGCLRATPSPPDEDELLMDIYEYIDRIFSVVKPKQLMYLAMDGVSPRAKIRATRAKSYAGARRRHQIEATRDHMKSAGVRLPPRRTEFNPSNMVPGTPFMRHLGDALRYYIHEKMNEDPAWMQVKVILSDTDVPGEGEHKILEFVRKQCCQPDHDPHTSHCVFGGDVDLILQALTTHQVKFVVMTQEHYDIKDVTQCKICYEFGHSFWACKGGSTSVIPSTIYDSEPTFRYIRIDILRQELHKGLFMEGVRFDLERAIDDWVILCFFLGSDIIPGLPRVNVRDGALSRMMGVYKKTVRETRGWLSNKGILDVKHVLLFLRHFAVTVDKFNRRQAPQNAMYIANSSPSLFWYKTWQEENHDQLYYQSNVGTDSPELRKDVASKYLQGLSWAALYYFQGCPDWEYCHPYLYAPLVTDFKHLDLGHVVGPFKANTAPMRPLEQLMCILHPTDGHLLPEEWANLMTDPGSPIASFYPGHFQINVANKRTYEESVAHLPIIDRSVLAQATEHLHGRNPEEPQPPQSPKPRPDDQLFVSFYHKHHKLIELIYILKIRPHIEVRLPLSGLEGIILVSSDRTKQGERRESPIAGLKPIERNKVCTVSFRNPQTPENSDLEPSSEESAPQENWRMENRKEDTPTYEEFCKDISYTSTKEQSPASDGQDRV